MRSVEDYTLALEDIGNAAEKYAKEMYREEGELECWTYYNGWITFAFIDDSGDRHERSDTLEELVEWANKNAN